MMLRPFYLRVNNPRYPLYRGQVGPEVQYGCGGEENIRARTHAYRSHDVRTQISFADAIVILASPFPQSLPGNSRLCSRSNLDTPVIRNTHTAYNRSN
jgi:hypothetical protein